MLMAISDNMMFLLQGRMRERGRTVLDLLHQASPPPIENYWIWKEHNNWKASFDSNIDWLFD